MFIELVRLCLHRPPRIAAILLLLCAGTTTGASATEVPDQFECLIEPMTITALGSETQGVLEELLVERGDHVRAGDIVARIRSSVERSIVEHARSRTQMSAEIEARRADRKLAELELARARNLRKQQLAAPQALDEALARFGIADAALRQALDNIVLAQLELERAEAQLAQRTLRSPVNGVVVETQITAGEFVYENPVMTIARLNPLRVEVVLSAERFGEFSSGDAAWVEPELGGKPLEARIDRVDPFLDSRSGTFGIRLLLNNSLEKVVAGQRCMVRFEPQLHAATPAAD